MSLKGISTLPFVNTLSELNEHFVDKTVCRAFILTCVLLYQFVVELPLTVFSFKLGILIIE